MALPLRNDLPAVTGSAAATSLTAVPWVEADVSHGFEPGGQVGQMQADLAARLAGSVAGVAVALAPEERFVRFASVAGGYLALAAAYVGVVFLFLR